MMTGVWWIATAGCSALFLLAVGAVGAASGSERPKESGGRGFPLLLGATVAIRLVLAATTKGYAVDVGTFSAWAAHAAEGLTSFYSPGYFADYPPGYLYVLWGIGKVRLLLNLGFDTPAFLVLLKLPAILADAATVWVLHRLARRYSPDPEALALAALYAFNPAVILDSAVWGQVDGVLTLFLLLGAFLLEERPAWSGASFAAALLVKPQALIFAPVPLLWFWTRFSREQRRPAAADLLAFAGAGVFLFAVAVWPFSAEQGPGWILSKYWSTLSSYPYAALNAFNFFALVGGNLASTAEKLLFWPYATWGRFFLLVICLFVALAWFRGRDSSRFWYTPLFLAVAVFVLSTKMHERYLFPALAFGLAYAVVTRARLALWIFAGLSVTQFFNASEVLALGMRNSYAVPSHDPILLAVSLANVVLLVLLAADGFRRYVN